MRKALALTALLLLTAKAYADDSIFYKIAHKDGYISFLNVSNADADADGQIVNEIASTIVNKPFYPEVIRSEYYDTQITCGIEWKGEDIVQYDYRPLKNDRFRHVFWVIKDTPSVVKLEIFDINGRLMYSAMVLDNDNNSEKHFAPPKILPAEDKGYAGFVNIFTTKNPDTSTRMLFTDGLNRFSVFRAPSDGTNDGEEERLIAYGNYIYSKNLAKFRYTVVGSIPFEKMEEIVNMMAINTENDIFGVKSKTSVDKK